MPTHASLPVAKYFSMGLSFPCALDGARLDGAPVVRRKALGQELRGSKPSQEMGVLACPFEFSRAQTELSQDTGKDDCDLVYPCSLRPSRNCVTVVTLTPTHGIQSSGVHYFLLCPWTSLFCCFAVPYIVRETFQSLCFAFKVVSACDNLKPNTVFQKHLYLSG